MTFVTKYLLKIQPSEIEEDEFYFYTEENSIESKIEAQSNVSCEMTNDEVIKLDNITEFQSGDAQHKALSPENILYCVDLQLASDADRWVQQTGFVRRILEDTTYATDEDLVRFEEAFKSRFSNTAIVAEPDVHVKLAIFQQNPKESLYEYSSALLHEFDLI
ncbi:hypothetical protein OnM2_056059 [Erysiphe neolycopersici]|uniref:Retrotransposon gag domain-containing protein n=1 Tax=Erysiphe neolycopersici TaxID=212602 RepID=A0A420HR63_9PEZI|nr:hypothetical protein OnM2_056059 [Erysiphe neolycopersici]